MGPPHEGLIDRYAPPTPHRRQDISRGALAGMRGKWRGRVTCSGWRWRCSLWPGPPTPHPPQTGYQSWSAGWNERQVAREGYLLWLKVKMLTLTWPPHPQPPTHRRDTVVDCWLEWEASGAGGLPALVEGEDAHFDLAPPPPHPPQSRSTGWNENPVTREGYLLWLKVKMEGYLLWLKVKMESYLLWLKVKMLTLTWPYLRRIFWVSSSVLNEFISTRGTSVSYVLFRCCKIRSLDQPATHTQTKTGNAACGKSFYIIIYYIT